MLYAAIDMEHKKVADIILGGDAAHLFQELIDLHNRMVPPDQRRKTFATLDEAKRLTLEAVHRNYFPETVSGKPAPAVQVQQPVATPQPQRTGTITPPWARTTTVDGNNNPNPSKTVQATTPPPPPQPAPPVNIEVKQADGPVARARKVFDAMAGHPRKEVIDACAKVGIKRSTAQTQYQAWKKAREEVTLPDPSKPAGEGNMPRLAPGTYLGAQVN